MGEKIVPYVDRDQKGAITGRYSFLQRDGQEWVEDVVFELPDAKAAKKRELAAACQTSIYAGFVSSALGAAHTYPANDKDQMNLTACVVASMLPGVPQDWSTPFWCVDGSGIWGRRLHSAAQIQQAGADGKAAVVAALDRLAGLSAQVAAASTVADVAAINW